MPPRLEIVKQAPCRSARPELALPGPGRDGPEFPAELGDALAVHVADHRHHQALGRVHGDAEMVVALVDQRVLLRRQRAVELGEFPQRRDAGLHQEGQQRHPVAVGLGGRVELPAVGVQVGDVRLVVVGDVGDVEPGPVQRRPGQPLDAGQRPDLNRAELREVLGRDLRDAAAGRHHRTGIRPGRRRLADRRDHVVLGDAALRPVAGQGGEVKAELAGQPARARPGVHPVEVRRRSGLHRGDRRPALPPGRSSQAGTVGARCGQRVSRVQRRRLLLVGQRWRLDVSAAGIQQQDR